MTEPLEPEVAPTTMICVIPRTPATTDDLSLQQIYDNQARHLDTLRHEPPPRARPDGAAPRLPAGAAPVGHVVDEPSSRAARSLKFKTCDHGRSSVLGRRPFLAPMRTPAAPDTHRHYTELGRCRNCRGLRVANVGTAGAREASPWFEAPDGDFVTWSRLYDAAPAAGRSRG